MVVEVRPRSGRLALTKVREPLFPFKNPSSQCYGPSSSVPIAVKTSYQIRRNLLRFGIQFRFRVWVYQITILASISCSHDQWASSCTRIGCPDAISHRPALSECWWIIVFRIQLPAEISLSYERKLNVWKKQRRQLVISVGGMIADVVFIFCKLFNYVYLFKLRLVFRVDISSSEAKLDVEP
jgi:hypothetical protein